MNIILDNGAFKPEFAHKTDAGADLRSPVEAVVPAHGSVVIMPCAYCEFTQVDKFAETERGDGGFGSTGR